MKKTVTLWIKASLAIFTVLPMSLTAQTPVSLIKYGLPGSNPAISESKGLKVAAQPAGTANLGFTHDLRYNCAWFPGAAVDHQGPVTFGPKAVTQQTDFNDGRFEFTLTTNSSTQLSITKISWKCKMGATGVQAQSKLVYTLMDPDGSNASAETSLSTQQITTNTDTETGVELTTPLEVPANKKIVFKNYIYVSQGGGAVPAAAFLTSYVELLGTSSVPPAPVKEAPTAYPTNFNATFNTTNNSIVVTWSDVSDADHYLIRARANVPTDGKPVLDTKGLDWNIDKGVQSLTLSTWAENATYTFYVFPYNNAGSDIKYLTAEPMTTCSVNTPADLNVTTQTVSAMIAGGESSQTGWVKGYVVGYLNEGVNTGDFIMQSGSGDSYTLTRPGAPNANTFNNLLIADNINETDYRNCMMILLRNEGYVREKVNLTNNFDASFRQLISFKGVYGTAIPGGTFKGVTTFNNMEALAFYMGDRATFIPTSIESESQAGLKVWGETNSIHITGEATEVTVAIYSLQGTLVSETLKTASSLAIPVQSGIYLVKVGGTVAKVIVQ